MNTSRHLDLTVIMPVAPGANPKPAIKALTRAIPKGVTAELLTVAGTHPTRQRNLAAFRAHGRILWFLDHDSIPAPDAAKLLLREFRNPEVAVAGGPNLAAAPATAFESLAGRAIASAVGSPFVRDRYRTRGALRITDERSLILCNLAIRRQAFVAAGGFDPRLYPNEENELLNRLQGAGGLLLHVPGAVVVKPRPLSRWQFLREAFRYGQGRAEQIWIHATGRDLKYVAAVGVLLSAIVWQPWFVAGAALPIAIMVARRPRSPLALASARLIIYAIGMVCGGIIGWRKRSIRLASLEAIFRRAAFRLRHFRIFESSSFDLGSITMKGAFRHA